MATSSAPGHGSSTTPDGRHRVTGRAGLVHGSGCGLAPRRTPGTAPTPVDAGGHADAARWSRHTPRTCQKPDADPELWDHHQQRERWFRPVPPLLRGSAIPQFRTGPYPLSARAAGLVSPAACRRRCSGDAQVGRSPSTLEGVPHPCLKHRQEPVFKGEQESAPLRHGRAGAPRLSCTNPAFVLVETWSG